MGKGLALRVLGPFAAAYFLSLFFRSINAVIAPDLVGEFRLGAAELGLLTAAYFLTFALFQIPLGVLLDRFGARRVQAAMVATAALGALTFALGRDLAVLAVGRGLIGLGFCGGLMSAYKQIADWFPKHRLPLLNGLFLGFGSLGAVIATAPAQAAVDWLGWRGMMLAGAGATLLAALSLLLAVPERPAAAAPPPSLAQQMRDLFQVIYRDPLFWRLAPMTMLGFASGSAIQTLWAGPWLHDVAGFDRPAVARQLMVMALALSFGSMFGGVIAEGMRRFGIGVTAVAAGASLLFMAAQVGIVLGWTGASAVLWAVFGASFNVVTLNYAALSQHFPANYAGRANTGMNVLSTGSAFALQYAIGGVIDLWPRGAGGGYDPRAYAWAFGLMLALQVAAFAWFLLYRPRATS
ncbi:MAG: MFS transporter [Alphaproteobacteria bacterium]|nr:MFS transporter [Alphaproteobacteria bacterium]